MGVISTQGFQFRLLAGENPKTQLDLFKDEDIKLSNNVTGIFDIGVLPADFTRTLTLPGSKINNAFFEHVYDISIDNPFLFATNIKVPCYFDFGGFYLSNGYLQLNKVNIIANKFIDSYDITIYGALSSFGRDINRAYLTDLTSLAQYNHTASYDNISSSWAGTLFDGDIVYPLADYGQGWQFTPSNIYNGIDSNEGSMNTMDFKPAIRTKVVWDAIFDYAGYSYSSSFMNESWWSSSYMMCNNALKYPEFAGYDLETLGLVKISPLSGSGQTDLVITKNTATNLPWYNIEKDPSNVIGTNSAYTITLDHSSSLQGILNLNINLSGSIGGPVVEFLVRETGSLYQTSLTTMVDINQYYSAKTYEDFAAGNTGQNTTTTVQQEFRTSMLGPGTYYFGIQWRDQFSAPYNNFKFTLDPGGSPKSYLEITKLNQAADGLIMDIPSNMPYGTSGIKLVDFISGIQKKYNLVIYPNNTNPNQFIVETFNNWYNKGQRWDFNKYINLDEKIEVIPANNFAVNKLNFGDTLDNDYVSQQFAKGANREYGKIYYTDTTNFYSQGNFEVKTTFASEPLVYLQGTGLSGSVGGLNPTVVAYYAGTLWVSTSLNPSILCNDTFAYDIYSSTGAIEENAVLYFDQYGASPLTGYRLLLDSYCQIWNISPSTGTVIANSGDTCSDFGFGCR
jgi:hypothetical protein